MVQMIVIQTQYRENYGTSTEPYWKSKGGSEYKVLNTPDLSDEQLTEFILSIRPRIEYNETFSEEYITDWFTAPETYLSWFEKSQLEFDGEILYKEPTINYEELENV
jgi:hypothetical protein